VIVAIIGAIATILAATIGLTYPLIEEWAKAQFMEPLSATHTPSSNSEQDETSTAPAPTDTRAPTSTPEPTDAPSSTPTSIPTDTPEPPTETPAPAIVIEEDYFSVDPRSLPEGTSPPSEIGSNLLVMKDKSSDRVGITSLTGEDGQIQITELSLTKNFNVEYTTSWWGNQTFLLQSTQGDTITIKWDIHGKVYLNDKRTSANQTLGINVHRIQIRDNIASLYTNSEFVGSIPVNSDAVYSRLRISGDFETQDEFIYNMTGRNFEE
jgi:hypothetical protein